MTVHVESQLRRPRQVPLTAIGLEKVFVELRYGSDLLLILHEQSVDSRLFSKFGRLDANCMFDDTYTNIRDRLDKHIAYSNSLSKHIIVTAYEDSQYRISQFVSYNEPLRQTWINYITKGLEPLGPESVFKPIWPAYDFKKKI